MDDDSFSDKSDSETPDLKIPTDRVLIRAFGNSVNLGSEDIAKRIADATNSKSVRKQSAGRLENATSENSFSDQTQNNSVYPKVGDYVRATYDDGVDYEAEIIFVNELDRSCVVRYIGYENQQEVRLCDLVPTWGKAARRLQYEQAKSEAAESNGDGEQTSGKTEGEKKKSSGNYGGRFNRNSLYFENIPAPPPPPMPPMFENASDSEENEHLAAMLMSWYMSGYYTGIYQGMRMNSAKSKRK